jgi:hypothetical protein
MTCITGRCQCGAVSYEISAEPEALYVCHCRECQRQSASAFGISLIVPATAFRIREGQINTWTRPTDSGHTLTCMFCPACGTRLWHADPDSDRISVKGGTLDVPPDLTHAVHIWTARKLPGVFIPAGARSFPGEPE